MNASMVPEYISLVETDTFQLFQLLILNCLAIIPNIYFFIKSKTCKLFNERTFFKYMTMFMSFEYIIACSTHIIYSGYIMIHRYFKLKVHLNTCSKINIFDLNINQILIVTPLYFNIIRFYRIVFQKRASFILIGAVFLITLGPLLYMMTGQYFEIKIYYVPKNGCGYQIFSNIPYYQILIWVNMFIILLIPPLSFLINLGIYVIVVRRKKESSSRKIKENKALFRGIAIQSFFPFCCQLPAILYTMYFSFTRNPILEIDIVINFVYYTGQAFCIFLSMIVINDFKIMMLEDFKLTKHFPSIQTTSVIQVRSKY
uniref:G_PROTEIN_RECEP_F1_2 domain-containing protein n=1 Tax=Parastrongyloides trichosuri TaxID=131310 RepID=A0A0N4ZW44_PARTI